MNKNSQWTRLFINKQQDGLWNVPMFLCVSVQGCRCQVVQHNESEEEEEQSQEAELQQQ